MSLLTVKVIVNGVGELVGMSPRNTEPEPKRVNASGSVVTFAITDEAMIVPVLVSVTVMEKTSPGLGCNGVIAVSVG